MNKSKLIKWLGVPLFLASTVAWSQAGEVFNAEVTDMTGVTDPEKAVKAAQGQWLAFSLPALEGTRSPCCWKGSWKKHRSVGCSLDSDHNSYGTHSDSPLTDTLIVFNEIHEGAVRNIMSVGEHCPVDGRGEGVLWLGSVADKAGLDWLEQVAHSGDNNTALFALALHRSKDASQRLYKLAIENNEDLSGEAIFWLGEARGKEGFKQLKRLLAKLPEGEQRREINFALSQNGTAEAAKLLQDISQSDPDPEQRSEAMFWLAQEYPEEAQVLLLEVIHSEQDHEVLEEAVFAISQLPEGKGDQMLLDIARDKQAPGEVRRQAFFWLAQSEDEKTIASLTELLVR